MALFGRSQKGESPLRRRHAASEPASDPRPLPGRAMYCSVCDAEQQFTKCWLRVGQVRQCTGCGQALENTHALYRRLQPACPHCEEFLEQPGFEYGLCDGCGSKFEIVAGSKPGMLPNRRQREEMNQFGRSRPKE